MDTNMDRDKPMTIANIDSSTTHFFINTFEISTNDQGMILTEDDLALLE